MSQPRYAGGCLCGAVRLAVSAAPYCVCICHCLDCRKRTGPMELEARRRLAQCWRNCERP